jgi:two-component system heavy metal sensor histidine kinase CusS
MNPLPFRLKIALLSTVISGVVLVGFGLAAYFMIARQKLASLDTEIRALVARHPGWINHRGDYPRLDESLAEQGILMIQDRGGLTLHTSSRWPKDFAVPTGKLVDDPKAPAQPGQDRGSSGGRGWGGMGRGLGPGGGGPAALTKIPEFLTVETAAAQWRVGRFGNAETTLVVGLDSGPTRAELVRLRNAFLLALPLALLLVGIGGWLVAGRALRPMRVIASTAEHVTARGLDQRIPISNEDPEITRVIGVLNRMMDRLENSFQQATRFSADASHELKTPLAIMQGELENALQEALPGSKEQQTFGNLLEETQRLKTITSGLLLLARADAGQLKPVLEAVNLTSMLEGILEDARALAEDTHLEFEVSLAPGIQVAADPVLLRTALLNLFVNAVKYNLPGGSIRATLESRTSRVFLTIGNSGPGIPEPDQDRIFTRFHRVDAARQRRVDGIGLGLSLAREILRAHGGELEMQESRPGWTIFVLRMQTAAGNAAV